MLARAAALAAAAVLGWLSAVMAQEGTCCFNGECGGPCRDFSTGSLPPSSVDGVCNPFAGQKLAKYKQSIDYYLEGKSGPKIDALRTGIASRPTPLWITGSVDVRERPTRARVEAQAQGALYHIVPYYIPLRDCGSHSAGGAAGIEDYKAWIDLVADQLQGGTGIITLEPDALPYQQCLTPAQVDDRNEMLRYAVETLTTAGGHVYIDSGNSAWHSPEEMARRLKLVGIEGAAGFALNTANSRTTEESIIYAENINKALGMRKGYTIDVGRNGAGPPADNSWCNVPALRIGSDPTLNPAADWPCELHGLVWTKTPGESDGTCNGGPPAGEFWPEYALLLLGISEESAWEAAAV